MNPEALPQPVPPQEEPAASKGPSMGGKVFSFLDRTGFLDVRKDDGEFEKWLQDLSFEDFSGYLTRINGMMRETPIKKRSVDGENVEIAMGGGWGDSDIVYLPPAAEDKEPLMRETFEAVKMMRDNDDRGLLTYYALQDIHPYSDGNGRTGRLSFALFSESGKTLDKERVAALVDHDKAGANESGEGRFAFKKQEVWEPRMANYLIARELTKELFGKRFLDEYGRIYYSGYSGSGHVPESAGATPEERKSAGKIIGESGEVPNFGFRELVILTLLKENGKLKDCETVVGETIKGGVVVPEDNGKKMIGIDDEKFLASLDEKDVRRLIEIHRDVKARFIRTLIDTFLHPEAHTVTEDDGRTVPIKDVLRHK